MSFLRLLSDEKCHFISSLQTTCLNSTLSCNRQHNGLPPSTDNQLEIPSAINMYYLLVFRSLRRCYQRFLSLWKCVSVDRSLCVEGVRSWLALSEMERPPLSHVWGMDFPSMGVEFCGNSVFLAGGVCCGDPDTESPMGRQGSLVVRALD